MDTQTKVAYACNILSMEGHTDTIYGHVSARVENAAQLGRPAESTGEHRSSGGVGPHLDGFPGGHVRDHRFRTGISAQCVPHTGMSLSRCP